MVGEYQYQYHASDEHLGRYGCWWPATDVVCAMIGGLDRQGFGEFLVGVVAMIAAVPLIKHAITSNPLLYRLDDYYINQWTRRTLDPDGDGDIRNDRDDQRIYQQQILEQVLSLIHI